MATKKTVKRSSRAKSKNIALRITVDFTDRGEAPPLQAYVFSAGGKLLGSAPVADNVATVEVAGNLDGYAGEVVLGPPVERGQPEPTADSLKRAGAYTKPLRILAKQPNLELAIPSFIFPKWCFCFVRGRLVKRFTLPDGTVVERPVCNARVTVCEVDHIPLVIEKLPERELFRLREDLLEKLRPIPWPPPPGPTPEPGPLGPIPEPGPPPVGPIRAVTEQPTVLASRSQTTERAALTAAQQQHLVAAATTNSVLHLRRQLVDLADLIVIHICDLVYLWPFFRKDCLTTVEADSEGRFSAVIVYDCKDTPDLYVSVEQFHDGAWHSVHKPSIGCGTHWNYACGTEIVLNLPGAEACEEPPYDPPPGVTLFVLPWAVRSTPIWGIPLGAPAAPDGWLRPDGKLNYVWGSLGWLYDAPFGSILQFVHDDSYFIPSSGIKYYRYSYRRLDASNPPNTGASDVTWTPITTPLSRGYRMEYSDRLPTYESYPVGPVTVGVQSGLFEFKPQDPPDRPTDPATVVVREWTSGNLSEVAASWDTTGAAPPLSPTNTGDDAGPFEVKIEVFDPDGNQVMPGPSTFSFIARNADGTTTRLATAAEEASGAYVLRVHVDNNNSEAVLPQPSIGGVAASDDCGFLRYEAGDHVRVRYRAAHPNDEAVFRFLIKRGSNVLLSASTVAPYVEVGAASAPTTSTAYAKVADFYQRDFTPAELVGTCVNAAFAADIYVFGKATNGQHRIGLDAHQLIAFALAEEE